MLAPTGCVPVFQVNRHQKGDERATTTHSQGVSLGVPGPGCRAQGHHVYLGMLQHPACATETRATRFPPGQEIKALGSQQTQILMRSASSRQLPCEKLGLLA